MTYSSTTRDATVRVAKGQTAARKSDKSDKRDDAFVLVVGLLAKSGETVGCLTGARKTFARNYAWQYSWPDTGARIQRLSR